MSYTESPDQSSMAMETQDSVAKPQASQVPDLVKIGQIPTNSAISVETDILDPVIANETMCRFQFMNKGILHSHSKIVFRMDVAPNNDGSYFPLNVGVHSLVQRCRLYCGTKTISEIDDFNYYMGYKSMFLSNEHQKEREQYVSGRQIAHRPYYDDGTNQYYSGSSDTSASAVGLDNGMGLSAPTSAGSLGANLELRTECRGATTTQLEFAISIQDLFPFLYQNQLPLYMIDEPVGIEIFFSNGVNERMCINGDNGNTGENYTIDHTGTKLVADYQYFPQEVMDTYKAQNNDMTFSYVDYRLSKRSIPVAVSGAEITIPQIIMNVGGAGRLATKVITMVSDELGEDRLLNSYHARGLMRTYAGVPATDTNRYLTSNLKYNDNFLYPVDITNPARQFHNVVQSEGMVPFVTRDEYSNQGAQTTQAMCEAHPQGQVISSGDDDEGLTDHFFYQAYKLNRNERVNQRGIEIYQTYDIFKNSTADALTYTLRAYVELVRLARLVDGKMEVYWG
jgi:hypothetical protein